MASSTIFTQIASETSELSFTKTPGTRLWTVILSEVLGRADLTLMRALETGSGTWNNGEAVLLTRSQLKNLMVEGRVTGVEPGQKAPEKVIRPNERLKVGTEVHVWVPPSQPLELIPEERALEILYEDEHLAVINKPPGLTVHPCTTQTEGTLVHALLFQMKNLSGVGGVLRPGIVHRLDKDTSGALVITKTDRAHQGLSKNFANHTIERAYYGICYGAPEVGQQGQIRKSPFLSIEPDGRLKMESLIGRSPTDRKRMSMQVKKGKRAVTRIQTLKQYADSKRVFASLLRLELETGRTHQIRVHLTALGHSLLADPLYGTPTERHTKWLALPEAVRSLVSTASGQFLHARVLGFVHPVSGSYLRFEAPFPPAFEQMLNLLGTFEKR